ncbi:MAG: 50S ribosomal protein L22 [Coriobacteriales bacterium]|jgi:large subunit ribosomal protein L22|nr:50S ribosomal protein L22 [Coriobacteriales bacterium]
MEAKAKARYVRVSPRKARLVIDLIRGQEVPRAREILRFSDRNIAEVVEKCLNSAVANAEREGVKAENLLVKTTFADEGPTLKRWRPRARGSAARIRKRTCHITVIVGTKEA